MCYSAQVEQAYHSYLRLTGAEMDYRQFVEIYGQRAAGKPVRIPRGFDRNFDNPRTDVEHEIKCMIDAYNAGQVSRLEGEIFAQRKRLADAERKLRERETKTARESQRIATDKAAASLKKLPLFKNTDPHLSDGRVFPMNYAPIVVEEGGKRWVRLARYHCRQAMKPPSIDRQYPGLYNARRDNLEKFWRNEFGQHHALMLVHSFYENVDRDGKNAILHFVPKPAGLMFIACVYARWLDSEEGELLSFAAITDEPPAEVLAAGHDRMIISIQQDNIESWLSPQRRPLAQLQAILSDRQKPYYEHQVLAA